MEKRLKERLQKYQEERQRKENEKTVQRAEDLLPDAVLRLLPGEKTFAHLDGQRQLLAWLTELPCLRPLRGSAEAGKLMDETLEDDPAAFLPALQPVISSVEKKLEEGIWEDEKNWQGMTAEQMVCAWYALRMYARMSPQPDLST